MINTELGRASNSANSTLQQLAGLAYVGSTPRNGISQPKISHWYGYARFYGVGLQVVVTDANYTTSGGSPDTPWANACSADFSSPMQKYMKSSLALGTNDPYTNPVYIYDDEGCSQIYSLINKELKVYQGGTYYRVRADIHSDSIILVETCAAAPVTKTLYWENNNDGVDGVALWIYKNGVLILSTTSSYYEENNGYLSIEEGSTITADAQVTSNGITVYLHMSVTNTDASVVVDTYNGNAFEVHNGDVGFSMDYNASILSMGSWH